MIRLPVVGQFTQWVQSKAEAIGCAAIMSTMTYGEEEYGTFLLTCNYSWGNLLGSPVYVALKPLQTVQLVQMTHILVSVVSMKTFHIK